MGHSQELVARTTLRIAGVFQEITESWSKRLDSYYNQLESLIHGEWLGPDDLRGVLTESKMASREALNGLGNDLSAQLVHESSGLFTRFDSERKALTEEISDLREMLDDIKTKDAYAAQNENQILRKAIFSIPDFRVLQLLQKLKSSNYLELAKRTNLKKSEIMKIMKPLHKQGYVAIDKKKKPHVITFIHAPWLHSDKTPKDIDSISFKKHEIFIVKENCKSIEGPF